MEIDIEQGEDQEERWLPVDAALVDPKTQGRVSERRLRLWALVLEARYLESRVESGEAGWQLLVPAHSLQIAHHELRLFVEENRFWPPAPPLEHPRIENSLATISILVLLATFHNLTRLDLKWLGHDPVPWVELGSAHASLILRGEWWRLITALTLHADWLHLLSNLSFGGIFIVYLCRDLGSGLAWGLLLAAGALGNLANAYAQLPSHSSVGSSTAVFGAVGILGALSVMRYRHHLQRRWPLPIAAALSLLALMGTEGKNTDLGAHLFGFLFGILLGLVSQVMIRRYGRPGRGRNCALAAACAALVFFCWWRALQVSP